MRKVPKSKSGRKSQLCQWTGQGASSYRSRVSLERGSKGEVQKQINKNITRTNRILYTYL